MTPLADRLRPKTIDEMVGQEHLIGKNAPLRRIIQSGVIPNMVFYGPTGVGKTTLARIIAESSGKQLYKLNGTTASTADIKAVIEDIGSLKAQNGILLYLDEIQYFNRKQQQTLLQFMENGDITLIASTAENPYFYVYSAILSRSTVFEFKLVSPKETEKAVRRAFDTLNEEYGKNVQYSDEVVKIIAANCGGDVRKAMNGAELSYLSAKNDIIDEDAVRELSQKSAMRYDREGDEHYDILSAFQKSMRGSDPDAAIHYLARLLAAGDLPGACRRLMVCACEDVGLAYPNIIPIVKAAVDAAFMVGLPEARIPLADAVVLVATSPKSNTAYLAIDAALSDIEKGKVGRIPRQLQNKHYDGEDTKVKGQFYKYPHDYPERWVKQQYLPDDLKDTVYYSFGENKTEQASKAYWDKIKK